MVATTMTIKYFDTLEYVKKSKEITDPEALAAYQVKQIETAIETAVQYVKKDSSIDITQVRDEINNKNWATKNDIINLRNELKNDIISLRGELMTVKSELELKIANLRFEMIKFIVWTGVGSVMLLGSMMAHGFHWL